jgi:ketosteroid isomerase-like protein
MRAGGTPRQSAERVQQRRIAAPRSRPMTIARTASAALSAVLCACATPTPLPPADVAAAREQVFAAERAFARTMADRDHAAFARHVSEDTVFFTGPTPLRGRAAVVEAWKRYYEGPKAPFSWEPDQVEVLASGLLAHSSGPVRNPDGKVVARFNSVWRQEAPGVWRVIFDRGEPVCEPCAKP